MELRDIIVREGVPHDIGGNTPFFIGDPAAVWLVETGRVEVFSVQVRDGQAVGVRLHFCSIGAGDLLVGMPPITGETTDALLAVGNIDTRLRVMPLARLRELAADPVHAHVVASLVDHWVAGLSAGVSRDLHPRTDALLKPGARQSVDRNTRFCSARGIVWIDALDGDLLFGGMEYVSPGPRAPMFPVPQDSVLQTLEPTELSITETSERIADDRLWDGLTLFHETVLRCETLNRSFTDVDEFNRTTERLEASRRAVGSSLVDLATVLERAPAPSEAPADDPLLLAIQAVGRFQAIAVVAPPKRVRDEIAVEPIDAIARASRFRHRRVSLTGRWWTADGGPLLAFIAEHHQPVALLPISPHAYELEDPRTRTRRPVTAKIAVTLEPTAHVLYRPFRDEALKGWELVKFGVHGLRSDARRLVLMGTVGGVLSLLPAIAVGVIFDRVIPEGRQSELLQLTAGLLVLAGVVAIFDFTRGLAVQRMEAWMDQNIQAAVIDRLLKLPIPFFRQYTAGDLAQRANGINQIRQVASSMVVTAVLGNIFAAFNVALLFYYDVELAVIACVLLIAGLAVSFAIGIQQVRLSRQEADRAGWVGGLVLQLLSGIAKLRVAGAELFAFSIWARHFALQKQVAFKVRRLANLVAAFNAMFPTLMLALLFALMARRTAETGLSTGAFLAFVAAFSGFLASTLAMTTGLVASLHVVPLFERVRPILHAAPEIEMAKPNPGVLEGHVELTRITFRYGPSAPLVLDDLSLEASPGQFIAIVGPSGSGKSTLIRLLLGFEQPISGAVHYDGKDLAAFDVMAIRRQIGVVLQTSKLMPGDLFSNITGSLPLTEDDVWLAARLAGIEDDIRAMPMGLHTLVPPGGGGLSGGQQQRLLIARAVAAKPRILLFDEATSALDNRTQAVVSESLERLQATRIVIAHRLSTIVRADRIYALDAGKIVQHGTYEELLRQPGLFRDLAMRQLVDDKRDENKSFLF